MVTVAETCRQLGISKVKFYELMNGGHIATVVLPTTDRPSRPAAQGGTPGGKRPVGHGGSRASRRVEQTEIDAFIKRNRVPAQ